MNTHTPNNVSESSGSFFVRAGWYSFLIPLFSPVIWFLVVLGSGAIGAKNYLGVACISTLCILTTSFVSGVVSAFGFSRHGRKRILWMAVVGIIASIILGFMSYVYWELSQNWHG